MTAATVPSTYRECLAFLFARNQFAQVWQQRDVERSVFEPRLRQRAS